MNETQEQFALAWWQPEQWDRLKEISEDRIKLDDSYAEWRRNATKLIKEIEAGGKTVKKISINLEELLAWCNEKDIPVNSKARAEYAAYVLQVRNN